MGRQKEQMSLSESIQRVTIMYQRGNQNVPKWSPKGTKWVIKRYQSGKGVTRKYQRVIRRHERGNQKESMG
jgi:hypothetical protein